MPTGFKIEHKNERWDGWGSECPPGHRIRIYCNNKLLEEKDNLSKVEEYLLLEKWKKKAKRPGFSKLLETKTRAFNLCDLCGVPLKDGGGSVWDISFCTKCYDSGKVKSYSENKQSEQEAYKKEQERRYAEDDERRKRDAQNRLRQLRMGRLVASNERGEFRCNDKTMAFVPYSSTWGEGIIEATLIGESSSSSACPTTAPSQATNQPANHRSAES